MCTGFLDSRVASAAAAEITRRTGCNPGWSHRGRRRKTHEKTDRCYCKESMPERISRTASEHSSATGTRSTSSFFFLILHRLSLYFDQCKTAASESPSFPPSQPHCFSLSHRLHIHSHFSDCSNQHYSSCSYAAAVSPSNMVFSSVS